MAGFVGPEIPGVTDGLIFYVDAALTYTSGSTTWYDKINGNNGTLTNGPTFDSGNGGSIVFDGTNDYVEVSDNSSLDIASGITIACWVYLGANTSGCGIVGKSSSSTRGLALAYGWNNKGFQAINWNRSNAPQLSKDLSRDIEKWVYAVSMDDGVTRTIYVLDSQGTRSATSTLNPATWNNASSLYIGNADSIFYGVPSNTKISYVHAYNRTLTPSEITQNYNALKSRFNL